MNSEKLKIFQVRKKKERNRHRKCHYSGCDNSTIRGHVFSKCILKNICNEENHFYSFLEDNEFKIAGRRGYFDKIGINHIAYTGAGMQCFCKYHDNKIFEDIEKNSDFLEIRYQHCMLFSYKSFMHELVKIENALFMYRKLKTGNKEEKEIYLEKKFDKKEEDFQYQYSLKLSEKIKMEKMIQQNKKIYKFFIFDLGEPIDFYMMGVTGALFQTLKELKLGNIFISMIPFSKKSQLIIGGDGFVLQKFFPNYFKLLKNNDRFFFPTGGFNKKEVLDFVSDKALTACESWCFSERFYNNNIAYREDEILDNIRSIH